MKKLLEKLVLCLALAAPAVGTGQGQITNIYGREVRSLGGKWDAIVDPYDQGRRNQIYMNRTPQGKTDFYEYSFDGGLRLDVPGDWNSQTPELKYYEGTVWYARRFDAPSPAKDKDRLFLYFGAVSYRCRVYLNGEEIGGHEGGFTPFRIEVTGKVKSTGNFLALEVNNTRTPDAIPAMNFDWWNYGGITRDIFLVSMPEVFVEDYFVRLDKDSATKIDISVKLSDPLAGENVRVEIPELKIDRTLVTDSQGQAEASVEAKKFERWSPDNPRLYRMVVSSSSDRVEERIGFRNIRVEGEEIFLNGEPVFAKSISFHEEIPQRMGRAFSEADAIVLLSEAKALGCNMIRLAHYPQNEHTVRLAERMGFMLWEEIPVWQGIDFDNEATRLKAGNMISETVMRDRNRCAVSFWGVANETRPSAPRNEFLGGLISRVRALDDTRLVVAAFDNVFFDSTGRLFTMDDPFVEQLDVVAVNKYMGWYHPWPVTPDRAVWDVARGKPLIVSEFGGEALYGRHGDADTVSSWSEDYQVTLYRDNLRMFENIPNLRGVSPWILFDFRSPYRFHPTNQNGWNRKGLVSDRGHRKKAWYVMKEYYDNK